MANMLLDFRIHDKTLALFFAHALYSTFDNSKCTFTFQKHVEHAKGYEVITNIILPEDFQASI